MRPGRHVRSQFAAAEERGRGKGACRQIPVRTGKTLLAGEQLDLPAAAGSDNGTLRPLPDVLGSLFGFRLLLLVLVVGDQPTPAIIISSTRASSTRASYVRLSYVGTFTGGSVAGGTVAGGTEKVPSVIVTGRLL